MAYDRINWENTPSHVTPLSAENLNTMDEAIDNIDEELNRVGVKAVNLEARMDTAEGNITDITEELTEQDTYAKSMGTKTLQHETDIATLQGQVTTIISGATPAGNEVTDIRTAENGTTYDTAGNAVRAQVRQMVMVQNTQPDSTNYPGNKLWIDESGYDDETQVPTLEEFSELKADLTLPNTALFGDVDDTFPLSFENGTYQYVSVGSTLAKYYGGGYDLTRKVVKSTVFNAPCNTKLTAKEGYSFTVFTSTNGVITGTSGLVTEYSMIPNQQYGVVLRATNGTDDISNTPVSSIIVIEYVANLETEIGDVMAKMEQITGVITTTENVDVASLAVIRGLINVSDKWSTSAGFYSYASEVSENYYKISVTANENASARIGFLKNKNLNNQQTPPYCDGITSQISIPSGTTAEFDIPADCTYIVITKSGSSNTDYTPDSIVFYKWGIEEVSNIPLGLHELPRSESALNIVKRCRQMTDIKWTPAVDLPRFMLVQRGGGVEIPDSANTQNYLGTFKAGTEYTGVPYGRVAGTTDVYGIEYATVGHYIDFETFVSSVSNENSRLCKEDVGSVSGHRSVIYATVCSGLTCYALNVSEVPTASIANISGLSFIGKLNDNGTLLADNKFAIGDVLNKYGYHTAIITDIIRDNDGIIQFVELSDASTAGLADRNYADGQIGGICRRKGWTREQLFDVSSWGDYSLYRYTKNVPYTPSKYVNVGDEFNMQRIEHFPVMPYEGEGFTFKDGYIPNDAVRLVIALDGYSYARVFKDGVEITGSPFAVTKDSQDVINPIDVTEIGAGSYSAYLCNMSDGDVTSMTYACHWTVTA